MFMRETFLHFDNSFAFIVSKCLCRRVTRSADLLWLVLSASSLFNMNGWVDVIREFNPDRIFVNHVKDSECADTADAYFLRMPYRRRRIGEQLLA